MSYLTALKRLARAVEALSPEPQRPARAKAAPKPKQGKARKPKRAPRPAQAFVPPVTEPDVTQLVETFAPPVETDEAHVIRVVAEAGPRPAAAPVPAPTTPGRRQCTAISAHTGKRCGLLEAHTGTHRHGQTPFEWVAAPGQTTFARDEELELASHARPTSVGTPYERRSEAQERQWYRRQAKQRTERRAP